jgi:predicted metalloprotease with PDZ domain
MRLVYLLLLCCYSSSIYASTNNYLFKIKDASHHLAEVELEFSDVDQSVFETKLPVWRSGRYEILNLSKNVRSFQAYNAQGDELIWNKTNKNTWQIQTENSQTIVVKYQIYANQLKDRVSHIDSTHAYLDASGVFMFNEAQRNKKIVIKLVTPSSWRSVSGLIQNSPNEFIASNYDHLIDAPIETGIHQFKSFKVEDINYEIAIWGKGNHDIEKISKDIEKLHYQAKTIWKTFPFQRYLFIIHAGDKLRGATEHVNSTIIQTDRFNFLPEEKYNKFINIASHELIHSWNVKAYRPSGISPYDYDKENYSNLFWLVEGTTSYFDRLLSVRGDAIKTSAFFKELSEDIFKYLNKPGKNVMSLEQSSFDTWMNQDSHSKHNYSVNIYLKGSMVSWLLDMEIRKVTKNKKSIDDLHYLLYKNHNNKTIGYQDKDVLALLNVMTNHDFSEFWNNYISGTAEINFKELLEFYGLQFETLEKDENTKPQSWIGALTKDNKGYAEVISINDNSPAWKAGITTGDQIIAINNFKVIQSNIEKIIQELPAEQSASVSYFNNGILKKTSLTPSLIPIEKLKIVPLDKVSKFQVKVFNDWLKKDMKEAFKK